jgi:radical S-adenosyl methionine domain-containing protein 2
MLLAASLTVLAILFASFNYLICNCRGPQKRPVSVNYHFTRECNYTCGFCFFTELTSHKESIDNAKRGLRMLKDAGMRKINFAGGEPFLYEDFLGQMIDFCKQDLQLESVSIVTNSSRVKQSFLERHGSNIDIIAVSCDSFIEATNVKIGRGKGQHIQKLYKIRYWSKEYGIKFKINTVVCSLNYQEDMNEQIAELQPFRWKCFQVLIIKGENDSDTTKRDARDFVISDEQYAEFCRRHERQKCFVPESNRVMEKSYLILDEYMRFLDRNGDNPSQPILEVGVQKALESVFWDEEAFMERGGLYDWKRGETLSCSSMPKELEF